MELRPFPAHAVERIVAHDGSLFADDPQTAAEAAAFMGWTHLASEAEEILPHIERLADEVRAEGLTDIVLMGMGGSSLAALVIGEILKGDGPRLHVLDTTSPIAVRAALDATDPATTIHLVSSKSGGTVEPNALYAIFRKRADEQLGSEAAGRRFIAVTDPGSSLEAIAVSQGFRDTVLTPPQVGGRFSALTAFGLLPAALLGVDVHELVQCALEVEHHFTAPGAHGDTLLANFIAHADKLTIIAPPQLRAFGIWIEQLVAESLGKHGVGVVPVLDYGPRENTSTSGRTRHDESIVLLCSDGMSCYEPPQDSDHLGLTLHTPYDIGGWFVLWEYSVALAGVALRVNPFDQPDVTRAKEATAAVLVGELTPPQPHAEYDGVKVTSAGGLLPVSEPDDETLGIRDGLFARRNDGDYLAILSYLPAGTTAVFEGIAMRLADELGISVCIETGPRYLHSTGQLHKGGPNTGLFLVVTARDDADLDVPGKPWTLGQLYRAQAEGDLTTLAAAGRRVMRLDLPDASVAAAEAVCAALMSAARQTVRLT